MVFLREKLGVISLMMPAKIHVIRGVRCAIERGLLRVSRPLLVIGLRASYVVSRFRNLIANIASAATAGLAISFPAAKLQY